MRKRPLIFVGGLRQQRQRWRRQRRRRNSYCPGAVYFIFVGCSDLRRVSRLRLRQVNTKPCRGFLVCEVGREGGRDQKREGREGGDWRIAVDSRGKYNTVPAGRRLLIFTLVMRGERIQMLKDNDSQRERQRLRQADRLTDRRAYSRIINGTYVRIIRM